jgi:hypothetical protein
VAELPVNVGVDTVPAGVPPDTDEDVFEFPVNVGVELLPAEATVLAPPVSPTTSKSVSPVSIPTSVLPAPIWDQLPNPKRVAGEVDTPDRNIDPIGQIWGSVSPGFSYRISAIIYCSEPIITSIVPTASPFV